MFSAQESLTKSVHIVAHIPPTVPLTHTYSLSVCSQLVVTDVNFQAVYDVMIIQVVLFLLYVLINDSYKAGRFGPLSRLLY